MVELAAVSDFAHLFKITIILLLQTRWLLLSLSISNLGRNRKSGRGRNLRVRTEHDVTMLPVFSAREDVLEFHRIGDVAETKDQTSKL